MNDTIILMTVIICSCISTVALLWFVEGYPVYAMLKIDMSNLKRYSKK